MKILSKLIILAVTVVCSTVNAQTYKVNHISLTDGLSQSSVMDIVQDEKGYIWMSTQDGLNRYDGIDFTVYREEPFDSTSISSNNLGPLLIDSKDRLWVGTVNQGLNLFIDNKDRFIHFVSDESANSISGDLITSIAEDGNGAIWIGTTKGLDRLVITENSQGNAEYRFENIPLLMNEEDTSGFKNVFDIHAGPDNKLWVGAYGGLWRIDLQQPLLPEPSVEFFSSKNDKLSDFLAWSIIHDEYGRIWVGNRNGIDVLSQSTGEMVRNINTNSFQNSGLAGDLISGMLLSSQGDIWIGHGEHGVQVLQKKYVEHLEDSFPVFSYPRSSKLPGLARNGRAASLLEDRITPGLIWTGFTAAGILKYVPVTKNFFTDNLSSAGLTNGFVSTIVKDLDGFVWIGTTDGLIRHDRVKGEYKKIPLKSNGKWNSEGQYVNGVAMDIEGRVLFGSGTDLFVVENKNSDVPVARMISVPGKGEEGFVRTLYTADDGIVYVLTRLALFSVDPADMSLTRIMSETDQNKRDDRAFFYSSVFIDYKGAFWIGTSTGLYFYEPSGTGQLPDFESPVIYTHDSRDTTSLRDDNILCINSDRNNHIWIGAFNGLSKLIGRGKDAQFRNFSTRDGLQNNMVYNILNDANKGTLWLSTNNGLTEFDPLGSAVITYDINDGIQSNEFNSYAAYASEDGELFFGGINGYSSFYPDQIVKDETVPLVNISGLKLYGNQLITLSDDPDEIIKIPYKNNSFSVNFIGLHYADPGHNQYEYRLEGFQDDWISTGTTPRVFFSKLPPGEYSFQVRASNSDGVFTSQGDSFTFVVRPPFWMTGWFYLILALIITGSLWALHKYRLRLKMAQMEEIDRIRKATAADFHDELGHKLTIINWFAQILKKKIGPDQVDLKPHLDKIIETSGTLYHTMKDMLWAMDPDKDSVYEIYSQLREFGQELFDNTGVTFESDDVDEILKEKALSPAHKRHVLLIFKEVMNNSLKHSKGTATRLSLENDERNIRFRFRDDGKGFLMNGQNVGNGLNNVKRRAKLINADIKINNGDVGTVAELSIPVK